jgi:hypothetical protein
MFKSSSMLIVLEAVVFALTLNRTLNVPFEPVRGLAVLVLRTGEGLDAVVGDIETQARHLC